jgi:hypothetical protein
MGAEVAQLGVVSICARLRGDNPAAGAGSAHLPSVAPFEHRAQDPPARRGRGPTLFDEIVEVLREHGPGGRESEDSIVLELV